MALLTVQEITKTGAIPTFVQVLDGDADTDDTFVNDGKTYIEIVNVSASLALVVTVVFQGVCNQGKEHDHDVSVTIAKYTQKKIGPFEPSWFNDSDNLVHVEYDSSADMTIGAFSL